jgi:hypothetical protein
MSDAIEIMQMDEKFRVPTGRDVKDVIEMGDDCHKGYVFIRTLRALLAAGFCFLSFAGCAEQPALNAWQVALREADNAILTTAEATHSTVKEQTAKLDAIATKLETLEASLVSKSETVQSGQDTSPDNNANDSQPVTRSVAESGDVPLFVSVAPFCSPCEALKKDWKAGKLKGFDVKFCVQTEAHRDKLIADDIPADRIKIDTWQHPDGFPSIRYPSKETSTGWGVWNPRGYGPRVLMELRATLLGEDTPVVREFPQAAQTEVRSIDLVRLHNQLHGGGGNWTWPGDLAEHLRNTHGVQIDGTASNYSGNQITSQRVAVRSVSRGPVINWRARSVSRSACPTCPR